MRRKNKMVNITQAMESAYLTVDTVRESPTRKCVILTEGEYKDAEFKGKTYEKFELVVEIDGRKKLWAPNKDSLKNISEYHGKESALWIGKIIKLSIGKSNGKDVIIGMPLPE